MKDLIFEANFWNFIFIFFLIIVENSSDEWGLRVDYIRPGCRNRERKLAFLFLSLSSEDYFWRVFLLRSSAVAPSTCTHRCIMMRRCVTQKMDCTVLHYTVLYFDVQERWNNKTTWNILSSKTALTVFHRLLLAIAHFSRPILRFLILRLHFLLLNVLVVVLVIVVVESRRQMSAEKRKRMDWLRNGEMNDRNEEGLSIHNEVEQNSAALMFTMFWGRGKEENANTNSLEEGLKY